ncbi:sigma factor [Nonomuraea sp. ZG12]|uniref:sigma factor n=1 Tax=Nonomuraea sp. ZG12 TaxID=3452207 RepID=UPI003F88672E
MSASERSGDLLRELAPQVLGVLLHRYGGFEECEDAVQEALLAAAMQWPAQGVPNSPRSWLVTVASRRLIDQVRSEQARRRRETTAAVREAPDVGLAPAPGAESPRDPRMARHHRLYAVRAHLQELAGECAAARENYRLAARRTTSLPEQRYLRARAGKLEHEHRREM